MVSGISGIISYVPWWLCSFVILQYSLSLAIRVSATSLSALWYIAVVSSCSIRGTSDLFTTLGEME